MEAVKAYTNEQIGSAQKLINVLMGIPEERRSIITAVATAYIDGVEAGTRLNPPQLAGVGSTTVGGG